MRMQLNKRGVQYGVIDKWIGGLILALVLFEILAQMYPQVSASATTLNTSGFPLAEFFTGSGILWIVVAAGLLILFIRMFSPSK